MMRLVNMFRRKPKVPGAYEIEQARLCRVAAQLAIQEGDTHHAKMMEQSAEGYDRAALNAVRWDREKRAGATPYFDNAW